MNIGGKEVKMSIDSGASCNVLPIKYLPKGTVVEKSSHTLKMYSKSTMSAIGKAKIFLVNPKNMESYLIDFTIVDGNFAPLLGLETAQQMKLLVVQTQNILSIREDTSSCDAEKPKFTKDAVMSEYSDVFGEELGRMEGKVHLESDPNVAPTVMPPRRVPVALKEKLKNELDRLTQRKVISPIQEPTDWVSSMISAKKPDGNIRLCIVPSYLNLVLKRSHYPLPVIEEILRELSKAKVFSKVDSLTQKDHHVTYASGALTQAEQRYSEIEKELLAQVFGLEHNHQYVYGRKVILYIDHKPLVSISRKPLASAPKRLEREVESIHAVDYLAMSEQQLSEIKQERAKDLTLQTLRNVILRGWPENSSSVPKEVSEYFNVRNELAVQDGIIFKGQRCVIPKTLRQKVKENIARAHIGIQGCLRRAREVVLWPGLL